MKWRGQDLNTLRFPREKRGLRPKAANKAAHWRKIEPKDPGLAAIIDAWPGLSEPIKAGILAMVRAAGGGG